MPSGTPLTSGMLLPMLLPFMASIRKHPKSKYWFACFTLPNGQRTQRSTKLTDRRASLRIANQWEEAGRKQISEAQARRVVSDIYEVIHGDRLDSATVEDFFSSWLKTRKIEAKPTTYEKYSGVAKQFLAFLRGKAINDISTVSPKEIKGFRDDLASRLSLGTANGSLKIIRAAFAQAYRDGLINDNPANRVPILKSKGEELERRPFTLPELKRILELADEEWKGIILFGLYTGQRLKDIVTMTWQNIDLVRDEIRFVAGKTGRRQIIPIAAALKRHLLQLPSSESPNAPLFPKAFGYVKRSKIGRASVLSEHFYRLLAGAGLVAARNHLGSGKGRSSKRIMNDVSFHCLRHTATSLLKNAGVSDAVAREFIGHDSPAISQNYTHIETSALRKAADLLPDISG